MIELQHLIQLSREYKPVLTLEKVFGHRLRQVFQVLFGMVAALSALGMLVIVLAGQLPPEAVPLIQAAQQEQHILIRALAGSLLGWLVLLALQAYWRSYYYRFLPTVLPDSETHRHVTYELAELLLSHEHPTQAFLLSRIGREILLRAGYEENQTGLALSPKEVLLTARLPDQKRYTLEDFVSYLAMHDEAFMKSLFRHGISKQDLFGSTSWVLYRQTALKEKSRRWGRERLGRIPGLAKDLAYGTVYTLEQYATPITKLPEYYEAATGGDDTATRQIEAILARGREANVLLSGEEGVGKLAALARMAHEITEGYAFPELEHKHIYVLDGQGLIASSPSKSDFETKLRTTLNEANKAGNVILAITDIHAVIASATNIGADFISLIDPYLTSRSLQIIGTTNPQAYFDLLEKIPKLLQRFDKVDLVAGDANSTITALQRAAVPLESRYGIMFTYPSLARLADNADRYITSGTMPDKALDVLTELATLAHRNRIHLLTEKHVNEFFSETTHVPVGEISTQEQTTLMNLETILHNRVIGQDEAVKAIATSMRRARAGIQNPNRPLGSFLFLGPTGVGKTEISKSLAAAFFGSEDAMTRFDMSEYKTADALDKLIGSFQTGQTGTLVKALKQQPYGLLLLDEFEKSTDQVKDLFLQVLDEGVFADMNGKPVSARTSLIIATSNAGADKIWDLFQAGKDPSHFTQDLLNAIIAEGIYKPELLNRFDGVIVFHPLNQAHLEKIASLMLGKLASRMLERKGISVGFDPDVISIVAERGANPQFGARPMNRYIQEHIEQIIADQIIAGNLSTGANLQITSAMLG